MKDIKELEIENKQLLEQMEILKDQNEKLLERVERAEGELRQILENKIQNLNFQQALSTVMPKHVFRYDFMP